jgi:hypothetical protein
MIMSLLILACGAVTSNGEVKMVRMKIAGYLCGN